tara:strand:+ start:112 stop:471 length:360 start_codon:yes stop_codon:yes gene_type:complete
MSKSIYDRTIWPAPEKNPLISMLRRGDEWYSNRELAEALELVNTTKSKSVVGHYKHLLEELGESETMLMVDEELTGNRHPARFYSRKALVRVAMRSRTVNAEAFRDWMASQISEGTLVL